MAGALEAPPPLAELLQAAEPRGPAALRGQQAAGATLALALHSERAVAAAAATAGRPCTNGCSRPSRAAPACWLALRRRPPPA